MSLFSWGTKQSCGEASESCDIKDTVETAKSLVATDPDDHCNKDLVSDEYTGIPVAFSDNNTRLRSGSINQPIKLDKLQKQFGGPFTSIMFQRADGTVVTWIPDDDCEQYRIVTKDGIIQVVPDKNSTFFDRTCECNVGDVTHVAGAYISEDCNGNERFQVCFVPVEQFNITNS